MLLIGYYDYPAYTLISVIAILEYMLTSVQMLLIGCNDYLMTAYTLISVIAILEYMLMSVQMLL